MSLFAPKLEVDMRFFFISANAVAVYADLYAHIYIYISALNRSAPKLYPFFPELLEGGTC